MSVFFSSATYSVTLDEELPGNQTLALVTATDLDAGSNQNLSYSISSVVALNNIEDQSTVASQFTVDALTGLVTTAASLDYEFVQRYRITVTATDDGDNQRSRYRSPAATAVCPRATLCLPLQLSHYHCHSR